MKHLLLLVLALVSVVCAFAALAPVALADGVTCRNQNRYYAGFYGTTSLTTVEADVEVLDAGGRWPGNATYWWLGMYNYTNGVSHTGMQVGIRAIGSGLNRTLESYTERLINGVYQPQGVHSIVGNGSGFVHVKLELLGGYVFSSINGQGTGAAVFIGTEPLRGLQVFQEDVVLGTTDCSEAESRIGVSFPKASLINYTHLPYVNHDLGPYSFQVWQGYSGCCYSMEPGEMTSLNTKGGVSTAAGDDGNIVKVRKKVGIPGMPLKPDPTFASVG